MITIGKKYQFIVKPGSNYWAFLQTIITTQSSKYAQIVSWDLITNPPFGMFLHHVSQKLSLIGDTNLEDSFKQRQSNFMMAINPLMSSLRSRPILFIFLNANKVFAQPNTWLDSNYNQFFLQFMRSDFTTAIFPVSSELMGLETEFISSDNCISPVYFDLIPNLSMDSSPRDLEVEIKKWFELKSESEKIEWIQWATKIFAFEKNGNLKFPLLAEIEKCQMEVLENILPEYSLKKMIVGFATKNQRKRAHHYWMNKMNALDLETRSLIFWEYHWHSFFAENYDLSIELLNEIVDDQLQLDVTGYLPLILKEYDEVNMSEDQSEMIEEIRELI